MKKLILFVLLGFTGTLFGQNTGMLGTDGVSVNYGSLKNNKIIDGTPYLFANSKSDSFVFADENIKYKIKNLDYNLLSKTLESKSSKDSLFVFDLDKVYSLKKDNKDYRFYMINNKKDLYELIYNSDKIVFLRGFILSVKSAKLNALTKEVLENEKYVIKERYFINSDRTNFIEIDLKKKNMLKLMGEKAELVEKYASESKLSFTSEKDLCNIFQYYTSL